MKAGIFIYKSEEEWCGQGNIERLRTRDSELRLDSHQLGKQERFRQKGMALFCFRDKKVNRDSGGLIEFASRREMRKSVYNKGSGLALNKYVARSRMASDSPFWFWARVRGSRSSRARGFGLGAQF